MSRKKSVKSLLVKALEDLSAEDFKKFKSELREKEPRFSRRAVEGADTLDLADLIIKVCTGANAGQVTIDTLNEIDCTEDAEKLTEAMASARVSDAGSSQSTSNHMPGASGSTEGSSESASKNRDGGKHLIDKYREDLIQRVTNVNAILDYLLGKDVITQEIYDDIRGERKRAEQMRELMKQGNIQKSSKGKDILYEALMKVEPFLMEDLK